MRPRNITIPELALIAGTRAALGAGVGLLLADHLNPDQRRAIGWTLLGVGVLTTVPLAAGVIFRRNSNDEEFAQRNESAKGNRRRAVAHAV